MTLQLRLVAIVTGLLCAAVAATAAVLAINTRNAVLAEAERSGQMIAMILARTASLAERLPDEVEEAIGQQMLNQATMVAHLVATASQAGRSDDEITALLRRIVAESSLDEIWVTNETGHAIYHTVPSVDFTFSPSEEKQPQASKFWPLLTGEKKAVVQRAMPREIDPRIFKYVGVGGVDHPRIVQVGYEFEFLQELRGQVGLERMVDALLAGGRINAIWVFGEALQPLAHGTILGAEVNPQPSDTEMRELGRVIAEGRASVLLDPDALRVMAPIVTPGGRSVGGVLVRLPTDGLNRSLRTHLYLAAAVTFAVLLLGAAVASFAARQFSLPILRMTAAAAAVEQRSFQAAALKPVTTRRDELGRLARVFQRMAEEVLAREQVLDELVRSRTIDLETKNRALEDAQQKMQDELELAQSLQQAMLPASLPSGPTYHAFATMTAARHVGGDFYDMFRIDDRKVGIVIGDVSGKGVPAAFFMVVSREVLADCARTENGPAACLARANALICAQNPLDLFVTVFYAELDVETGLVRYASAGHNLPYRLREAGAMEELGRPQGMALGVFDDAEFGEALVSLQPGDALFLFTDGITEAHNASGAEFTSARLRSALAEVRPSDPEGIARHVLATVANFAGGAPQHDDLTCLALCYTGGAATEPAAEMIELIIPNRPQEIAKAQGAVERFCRERQVPERATGQFVLALDELLTNVMSYAWPQGGDHTVTLRLSYDRNALDAEIIDDGQAFNPLEAEKPDLDASVEERQIGGLGIHFVRSLMDDVSYRRDGERNRLTLRKTFEPQEP